MIHNNAVRYNIAVAHKFSAMGRWVALLDRYEEVEKKERGIGADVLVEGHDSCQGHRLYAANEITNNK